MKLAILSTTGSLWQRHSQLLSALKIPTEQKLMWANVMNKGSWQDDEAMSKGKDETMSKADNEMMSKGGDGQKRGGPGQYTKMGRGDA